MKPLANTTKCAYAEDLAGNKYIETRTHNSTEEISMGSSRQESESIDKRNAAIMQLEMEHRRMRLTLSRIVSSWSAGEGLSYGLMEEADLALRQIKER